MVEIGWRFVDWFEEEKSSCYHLTVSWSPSDIAWVLWKIWMRMHRNLCGDNRSNIHHTTTHHSITLLWYSPSPSLHTLLNSSRSPPPPPQACRLLLLWSNSSIWIQAYESIRYVSRISSQSLNKESNSIDSMADRVVTRLSLSSFAPIWIHSPIPLQSSHLYTRSISSSLHEDMWIITTFRLWHSNHEVETW